MAKSYQETGVNYQELDPLKIFAQETARSTAHNLHRFNFNEIEESRGESAYVWEEKDSYRAMVIEGLGTKNLVADAMYKITGKTYYDQIAKDTVAMILNDLIVVGADPMVVNAYFGLGSSEWLKDKTRYKELIVGWSKACNECGAVYGGGETPVLKNIIFPDTIDLAGSAVGIIKPKERLCIGNKLKEGDSIILIESSGYHANGLTLARDIAQTLPDSYASKLPSGVSFGESILTPTHLYASVVRDMFENDLDIHYMVNITGHGWRKLMRANPEFTYKINQVPKVPEIFNFVQEKSGNDLTEMYSNFNMGAGFAVILPEAYAPDVLQICAYRNLKATIAGELHHGPKQVNIKSLDINFLGETLQIR